MSIDAQQAASTIAYIHSVRPGPASGLRRAFGVRDPYCEVEALVAAARARGLIRTGAPPEDVVDGETGKPDYEVIRATVERAKKRGWLT